ncbi:hypothetical protein ACFOTA_07315 [Chitinophaga sp. GCM10012297]|uniref:Uncharacterized protein n=1 Tax=Chitinophaga chungangae TaxID=2821488 RepID=A0ABS3YBH2_9BACT|nr:hypothetical protein [Chitinophaga chungangae]MBO9152010.1 hypothetical protein [Chitinophaga chungangae]
MQRIIERRQQAATRKPEHTYYTAWAFFVIILNFTALHFLQSTIVPSSFVWISTAICTALMAVLLYFVTKLSLWRVALLSVLTGFGLASGAILSVNYAFKSADRKKFDLPVKEYKFKQAARRTRRKPAALIDINGVQHELYFPAELKDNYAACQSVTVWAHEGYFGLYVVDDYQFHLDEKNSRMSDIRP